MRFMLSARVSRLAAMEGGLLLAVVVGAAGGLVCLLWLLRLGRGSGLRLPPERSGCIPWLGCALEFGRAPLFFIQETRQALGDVFTIHAAGQRMTFVTDHADFKSFFQNSNISFQAAVQPFTLRAGGLSTESFFKYHSEIHDAVKAKLVPSYIFQLCPKLCRDLHTSFSKLGTGGKIDLMTFVRLTMFDAVVRQLFGADNMPHSEAGMRELERKFVKFDQDFEYGTQFPEFLIRDWSECKHWLIAFFKNMVKKLKDKEEKCGDEQLMIEKIIATADSSSSHNYALLFLWASQANAIPVVFWCLGHILNSPNVYKKVQKDVENVDFLSLEAGLFAEAFRSTMSVRRCVLETMRLHAPGMITRMVTSTHKIGGYDVPAGHYLMLSPFWSHRDREKFPNPESFDPERWLHCDLERNQFLDGFVGFGGGRYQCPGRWLAVAEMHLCVAMALQLFDLKLLDPLPDINPAHLIGVQQPKQNCRIHFQARK